MIHEIVDAFPVSDWICNINFCNKVRKGDGFNPISIKKPLTLSMSFVFLTVSPFLRITEKLVLSDNLRFELEPVDNFDLSKFPDCPCLLITNLNKISSIAISLKFLSQSNYGKRDSVQNTEF